MTDQSDSNRMDIQEEGSADTSHDIKEKDGDVSTGTQQAADSNSGMGTAAASETSDNEDRPIEEYSSENLNRESVYRELDLSEAEKLGQPDPEEVGNEPSYKKHMEALEIDTRMDESFDEENGDMKELLGGNSRLVKDPIQRRQLICGCLARPEKVGNMCIFLPTVFARTGWGIAGPHWFGPICVLFLIYFASHYFVKISLTHIGPITAASCVLFTLGSTYNLVNVAYRDPGVVKLQPEANRRQQGDEDRRIQFRWCDLCQCFQPPDGAHCSDCNACMAGFDHHCVWMGTCIGKKNYKQFVLFNITWLLYLIYAILWVSVMGPLIFSHHRSHHTAQVADASNATGGNLL